MTHDMAAVGKIVGFQGLNGEVKVQPLSDNPVRYESLKKVKLVSGEKKLEAIIESGWSKKNTWILKFKNFKCREEVEELKGYYIMIPKIEREELPADHFYHDEIIGLSVYTEEGKKIGVVTNIIKTGSNDVFVLKPEDSSFSREILIPARKEVIKEVNLTEKILKVRLLEGLLD